MPMPLTRAQAMSEVTWHLVTDESHGYSQPHRMGDGTEEDITLSDGEVVTVHGGAYDCSECMRVAVDCALTGSHYEPITYMWTGSQRDDLLAVGFTEVGLDDVQDGDILLTDGHTEMVIDMDGRLVQAGFRHSEDYGIDGEPGDQTGDESGWSDYDPSDWETAFRYAGPEREDAPEGVTIIDNRKELDMTNWAIIAFDGCGYLYDGAKLHPLHSEDEQKFVEYLYGEAKRQRDAGNMPHIPLGDGLDCIYGKGPWGKKLAEILAR